MIFRLGLLSLPLISIAINGTLIRAASAAPRYQDFDSRRSLPDITHEQWSALADQRRLEADDRVVLSILSRLPNISAENWRRYAEASKETKQSELVADPSRHAARVFRLEGLVQQVHSIRLQPDLANEFQFDEYYLVDMRLGDGSKVVIVSRFVPQRWLNAGPLSEPSKCYAYFLLAGKKSDERFPVFASASLSWYPESNWRLIPSPGHRLLAQAGFDLALLDSIQHNTLTAVKPEEKEAFFELLDRVDHVTPSSQDQLEALDLVELMQNPSDDTGHLFAVSGNVRRITPVQISSPEDQARLGLSEYFQLDVFVSIGDRRLRFVDRKGNEVTNEGSFGVTVILPRLPAGWTIAAEQRQRISLPCFFFKQWRHRTAATENVSDSLVRPNPIFIGVVSQLRVVDDAQSGSLVWVAGSFFGGFLLIVVALVGWNRLTDSRVRSARHAPSDRTPNLRHLQSDTNEDEL